MSGFPGEKTAFLFWSPFCYWTEEKTFLFDRNKETPVSEAILLPQSIGAGKEREVETLFADTWRKLVLIRLRANALLADHSAKFPITIHAVLGKGVLNVAGRVYPLEPGTIVPVEAHAVHNVQAEPELAILVTFFRQPAVEAGADTTARFD